ncbi:hypothetical protein H5U98_22790 [Mycolicibacterium boenickei]|uniref:DNA-binding protein n=1 Tax=Mycolicibacterium boenickei TaxID=146017 RepID=A0AAX2ZSR9_9MYCO|nr:hypothetical protein [Mycolicibacterium boenickei]PEG62652.1 hypothetical protein CQY21_02380 [Mycolicibacterium boenickei]UNB98354.1 hypothetical protein H5U98_22790 [Mycolicibacterium boenickei]BBX94143.1 hypothetical protein MBOE_57920 [Mycolicibacterium boenickei]
MILSDAELVLGLSRHLSAYAKTSERADLDTIEFAGWIYDLAFRLQGSTTNTPGRVRAMGRDIGLGQRDLTSVVATMEQLGWLIVDRDAQGRPLVVTETMPAPGILIAESDNVLTACDAQPHDYAALSLLRATTLQPLVIEDALAAAKTAPGASDETAEDAVRTLIAVGLVRRVRTEDGRDVVYNPNVWAQGDQIAQAALAAADARSTVELRGLLEELAENPGLPEAHVTSTEPKWINFAIAQGLVQRSFIQTSEGIEQGFLFTPHLGRDPFGGTAGDASGQVRQLVGSMIYAATFAEYRLQNPALFLRRLIENGVAGDVTSIGTDYPMLEKAGIVKVIQGSSAQRYRLELLRSDVAESALSMLSIRDAATSGGHDAAALRAQRSYVHVERERARLGLTTDVDEVEQQRLLSALREVPVARTLRSQK